MKRAITVLFLLTFAFAATAQTSTYRWVDEDGVVHYSDSPNPASENPEQERVKLSAPNVVQSRMPAPSAPSSGRTPNGGEASEDAMAAVAYRSIDITSPASDQVLWNTGGQLTVNVQTEPALQPGHGVVVILDGKPMQDSPVASSSIGLSEVWRGEHTLRAVIRGADGKDLIGSDTITFYVQQTTLRPAPRR